MDRIEEIKARCEASSAGPWVYSDGLVEAADGTYVAGGNAWMGYLDIKDPNIKLLLHAREDVSYLLDELAARDARIAKLEQERGAQLDALREQLYGLSYVSSDWSRGIHPRVVELDEINELIDERNGQWEV